ncbi:unnamed protein product [Moneuplotes crassus]|uniref:Uncharacterized protein n=1 Tax=Euplotes crassus TaxID=5936 RepID=A0AAD2CVQ4_EUPCR|nr:unnamed protein product [Moneuplotes crassus]
MINSIQEIFDKYGRQYKEGIGTIDGKLATPSGFNSQKYHDLSRGYSEGRIQNAKRAYMDKLVQPKYYPSMRNKNDSSQIHHLRNTEMERPSSVGPKNISKGNDYRPLRRKDCHGKNKSPMVNRSRVPVYQPRCFIQSSTLSPVRDPRETFEVEFIEKTEPTLVKPEDERLKEIIERSLKHKKKNSKDFKYVPLSEMKSPSFGTSDVKNTPKAAPENIIKNPDFSNNKDGMSYIQRRDQMLKDDLAHIEDSDKRELFKSPDFDFKNSPFQLKDPHIKTEKYPGIFDQNLEENEETLKRKQQEMECTFEEENNQNENSKEESKSQQKVEEEDQIANDMPLRKSELDVGEHEGEESSQERGVVFSSNAGIEEEKYIDEETKSADNDENVRFADHDTAQETKQENDEKAFEMLENSNPTILHMRSYSSPKENLQKTIKPYPNQKPILDQHKTSKTPKKLIQRRKSSKLQKPSQILQITQETQTPPDPQIPSLQSKITSLQLEITSLKSALNTQKDLNSQLQNSILDSIKTSPKPSQAQTDLLSKQALANTQAILDPIIQNLTSQNLQSIKELQRKFDEEMVKKTGMLMDSCEEKSKEIGGLKGELEKQRQVCQGLREKMQEQSEQVEEFKKKSQEDSAKILENLRLENESLKSQLKNPLRNNNNEGEFLKENQILKNQVQLQRKIIQKLQAQVQNMGIELDQERLISRSISRGRKKDTSRSAKPDSLKLTSARSMKKREKFSNAKSNSLQHSASKIRKLKSSKKVRDCYKPVRMDNIPTQKAYPKTRMDPSSKKKSKRKKITTLKSKLQKKAPLPVPRGSNNNLSELDAKPRKLHYKVKDMNKDGLTDPERSLHTVYEDPHTIDIHTHNFLDSI